MATLIRDALEITLLAGIKAWGLQLSDAQIREGLRCFNDDDELLAAAETLDVSRDILNSFPSLLEQHPSILDSEEVCHAFHDASHGQVESMVKEVSEVLDMLKPLLQHEVDPDYFSIVLGTLVYLAIKKSSLHLRKASHLPILLEEMTNYHLRGYANAVNSGGWQEVRKAYDQIMATELGHFSDKVVRRQARRAFTLLVTGDRQAMAMILAHIIEEVNHAHNRTDTCSHEVDKEEA